MDVQEVTRSPKWLIGNPVEMERRCWVIIPRPCKPS